MEQQIGEKDDLVDWILIGFEKMQKFRGFVIEKAIQLDVILENIISNYFSKENKEKNEQFRKILFDSNFITGYRKIVIFNKLNLHKKEKIYEDYSDLVKRLEDFNTARNDFAHLTRDTYHPEFKVKWKGKEINAQLDEGFKLEIEDEFQYLVRALLRIQHKAGLMIQWPIKDK